MSKQTEHEQALDRSFILPARQNRYHELLPKLKRRKDVCLTLAHLKHLDMRYTMPIPPSQQSPTGILNILRSEGAGDLCYAISEDDELNGKELELDGALAAVAGRGMGTFFLALRACWTIS